MIQKNKKQCGHLRCGATCRFGKKEKKVYRLKRTRIKKKFYRIPKVSAKRKIENEEYFASRESFLKQGGGRCELSVPGVCTKLATEVHHPAGRCGKNFLDLENCMRSCRSCNGWVERNDSESRKMGLKRTRLGPSEKRPKM